MTKRKKIWIFASSILMLCLIAAGASVYSWYVQTKSGSNNFDVEMKGNVDNVSLLGAYVMNDSNYDGIMDPHYSIINDEAVAVDSTQVTFQNYMTYYYTGVSGVSLMNIAKASKINYRVLVKSTNSNSVQLNMYLPFQDSNSNESRILYSISHSMVREVSVSDYESEKTMSDIQFVDKYESNTVVNFNDLSHMEYIFSEDVSLSSNSIAIIDFTVLCMVNDDEGICEYVYSSLDEKANGLKAKDESSVTLVNEYVQFLKAPGLSKSPKESDIKYQSLKSAFSSNKLATDMIDDMYHLAYSYQYMQELMYESNVSIVYDMPGIYVVVTMTN